MIRDHGASLIFVFGTLKQGFPNAGYNQGERLPGRWHTAAPHPLYLIGDRFSPWLVDLPGKGFRVTGELYRVTREALAAMDRLERIDRPDGYRRTGIDVVGEAGETRRVQVYLKPPEQLIGADIRLGPLAEYQPIHAALYRRRDDATE